MQTEDFVTFDQAKKLKELGFDWECDFIYYITYHNHDKPIFERCGTADYYKIEEYWNAPTLSQVQKWLFERYGYFLSVQYNSETEIFQCVIYKQTFTQGYYCTNESYVKQTFQGSENIRSYIPFRCLSKGISKLLEFLKK